MPEPTKETVDCCESCGANLPESSNLPLCDECFTQSCDSCCSDG